MTVLYQDLGDSRCLRTSVTLGFVGLVLESVAGFGDALIPGSGWWPGEFCDDFADGGGKDDAFGVPVRDDRSVGQYSGDGEQGAGKADDSVGIDLDGLVTGGSRFVDAASNFFLSDLGVI